MFDEKKAIEYMKEHLLPQRLEHCKRVADTAKEYAIIWNANPKKAYIAGLLHDSGKWISKEDALKKVKEFGIILDDEFKNNYNLVHGILGKYIAKNEFDISDEEILNAILYHVTGRVGMTTIDKCVYLADKLEPARDYDGVLELRTLAKSNIDEAVLAIFDGTIKLLIDRGEQISPRTIEARNWLLLRRNNIG